MRRGLKNGRAPTSGLEKHNANQSREQNTLANCQDVREALALYDLCQFVVIEIQIFKFHLLISSLVTAVTL